MAPYVKISNSSIYIKYIHVYRVREMPILSSVKCFKGDHVTGATYWMTAFGISYFHHSFHFIRKIKLPEGIARKALPFP